MDLFEIHYNLLRIIKKDNKYVADSSAHKDECLGLPYNIPYTFPAYWTQGNSLAHIRTNFRAKNTQHDPFFIAPPITDIPDYVWSREYDKPCYVPGRPIQKPKEEGRRISHPDAESALQAAKRASRAKPGRWFGRPSSQATATEFLVLENGQVIERHVVGR